MKKMKLLLPLLLGGAVVATVVPTVVTCTNNSNTTTNSYQREGINLADQNGGESDLSDNVSTDQNVVVANESEIYDKVKPIVDQKYDDKEIQSSIENYLETYFKNHYWNLKANSANTKASSVKVTKNANGTYSLSMKLSWDSDKLFDNNKGEEEHNTVTITQDDLEVLPILVRSSDYAVSKKVDVKLLVTTFNPFIYDVDDTIKTLDRIITSENSSLTNGYNIQIDWTTEGKGAVTKNGVINAYDAEKLSEADKAQTKNVFASEKAAKKAFSCNSAQYQKARFIMDPVTPISATIGESSINPSTPVTVQNVDATTTLDIKNIITEGNVTVPVLNNKGESVNETLPINNLYSYNASKYDEKATQQINSYRASIKNDIWSQASSLIKDYTADELANDMKAYFYNYQNRYSDIIGEITKNEVTATKTADNTFDVEVKLSWNGYCNENFIEYKIIGMEVYPVLIKDKNFKDNGLINIALYTTSFNPLIASTVGLDVYPHLWSATEPTETFKVQVTNGKIEGIDCNGWLNPCIARPVCDTDRNNYSEAIYNSYEQAESFGQGFDLADAVRGRILMETGSHPMTVTVKAK